MKYSFFSSACTWFPSALMMAVSASGASSAPLASCVKYVPAETDTRAHTAAYHQNKYIPREQERGNQVARLLPLCLAKYLPRTIIRHSVMKTTTATTPPIKAWSGPCCPSAFGSETRQKKDDIEEGREKRGVIIKSYETFHCFCDAAVNFPQNRENVPLWQLS